MQARLIADSLKTALLQGQYSPGEKLQQQELAARYGCSRIPVRDALALLAIEGLVVLTPNRGARVLAMTPAQVAEAFDLRVMLECDLLRRAIPAMQPDHLDHLRYALRRSDLEALGPDWAEGDRLFHQALYGAAARPRQQRMVEDLRIACQIQIAAYRALPERTADWLEDHRNLVALVEARQVTAAVALLEQHLRRAQAHLLAVMSVEADATAGADVERAEVTERGAAPLA